MSPCPSCGCEAHHLLDTTTQLHAHTHCFPTVVWAFISGWIACFATPSAIFTDRGRQFESELFTHLMHLLGTKCFHMTAYHPITNGMVERLHRQLKASLKVQPDPTNWTDSLPRMLLGIRTAVKKDICCTAAELVYGSTLSLPGQFFFSVRHQPYFIRTAPQVYHAAASWSTCLFSLSSCSHSQQVSQHAHMFCLTWCHTQAPTTSLWWAQPNCPTTHPNTMHLRHSSLLSYQSPWIVSSMHTMNYLILQYQLQHHPTYRLTLSEAQPPQHLHHELLAPDNRFAGLNAFITKRSPSLWVAVAYGTHRHTVLYFILTSVFAILTSMQSYIELILVCTSQ